MANDYINSKIASHLYQKACYLKKPLSGTFELSPLCNMSCRMCYIVQNKENLKEQLHSLDEWYEIAKTAKDEGMLYLLLTGGEPFLIEGFKEFYIKLYRLGLIISINSNATLISEETVSWLKLYPPERINITVYGGSNETYARLCHNPFGFDQMRRGVSLLKKAGINVKFNLALTPYNADDLTAIIDLCKEMDYPVQFSSYMFPRIRNHKDDCGSNEARFSPEQAAQYYLDFLDLYYGQEKAKRIKNEMTENGYSLDISCEVDVPGEQSRCSAARCAWWLAWDGTMSACGMFTHGEWNVFKDGFTNAWQKLVESSSEMKLSKICQDCKNKEICHPCAAMAYTETGKFEGVPEYRCQMTQWMIKKILTGR